MKCSEQLARKLDEYFERGPADHLPQIKQLMEKAKQESVDQVNAQLIKFKEIGQIGTFYLHQIDFPVSF